MIKSNPNFDLTDRSKWIGVIGSRNCTEAERKAAFEFAYDLASSGYIVVSGLALGIDTAAHQGALMKGQTVAIVNTPSTQKIYPPQNQRLAEDITTNGCIIHLYNTHAHEVKQDNISQFSKRLIERDAVLAWACSKIVAVKNDGIIDGGTRYACNYGYKMNKPVYRLDNNLKLHKNPEVKNGKIWWKPEVKMDRVKQWFNYKLEGDYTENEGGFY